MNTEKAWWKRNRVRGFAGVVILLIMVALLVWWSEYRSYISTNDARVATKIIRIAPEGVGGVIRNVAVEEGALVKTGQILVEIDPRIATAQYQKAKARFELARIEMERIANLLSSKFSSKREMDNARTNYDTAAAELKLAEIYLEHTKLISPLDGIVIQKLAQPGNLLEPGQVAITISDIDHAWIAANIEETKVAAVKPGQAVVLSIDEGGQLTGKVAEITSATAATFSLIPAENASGNYTKVVQKIPIKIVLDPHPNKILKTGQSVTIKIRVR